MNLFIIWLFAHSIQIKSVPTVFLISGGNSIDGFTGLQSEQVINRLIDLANKVAGGQQSEQSTNVTSA